MEVDHQGTFFPILWIQNNLDLTLIDYFFIKYKNTLINLSEKEEAGEKHAKLQSFKKKQGCDIGNAAKKWRYGRLWMLIIRWWCECVTFGFLHVVKQSAQGFNCSPMSRYLISSTSPCCVIIPPWNWLVASTQHALGTLRQRPFRLLRAWEQPALLLFFLSFFLVIFS